MFFTPDEVVLALPAPATQQDRLPAAPNAPPAVARMQFAGMNSQPTVEGIDPLPGVVNYFIGNDPTQWHAAIPTYAGIVYKNIYPGIDLRYDGVDGQLKATYHVAPGADPGQIRWRYQGASGMAVDSAGNLQISIPQPSAPVSTATVTPTAVVGTPRAYLPLIGSAQPQRTITEQTPVSWQERNGTRTPVSTRYQLATDGTVQFALGSYDRAQPLVLDPVLRYSRAVGGTGTDEALAVTVNAAGEAYVVGSTGAVDFPTQDPYQGSKAGGADAFVSKLSADGTSYVWSTYLGGSGDEGERRGTRQQWPRGGSRRNRVVKLPARERL